MAHPQYTHEDIRLVIENKRGVLLSTEYKNNKTHLEILCLKCNKVWFPAFASILKGCWCRCCRNPVNSDIIGQKFNHLIVIKFNERVANRVYYDCKCDCGSEKIIKAREDGLKGGTAKSCGCTRVENLIGQQFGDLTIISKIEKYNKKNHKKIFWECVCKCGANVIVRSGRLYNNSACKKCSRILDICNNVYGKLTVLRIDYNYKTKARWLCRCECDNIVSIRSASLINGLSRSCGCCRLISEDEVLTLAENILGSGYEIKRHCRLDFLGRQHVDGAVYKDGKLLFCVEYDGIQHFKPIEFWGGVDGLKKYKMLDRKKNKIFKKENIPLIRFSYKDVITEELVVEKLKELKIL